MTETQRSNTKVREFDRAIKALHDSPVFSMDIETTGLNAKTDRIIGVALATDTEHAWYIPFIGGGAIPFVEGMERLRPILADPGKLWVNQNLSFDISFLLMNGFSQDDVKCRLGCTMVLAWLNDERRASQESAGRLKLKGKGGLVDELFDKILTEWKDSELADANNFKKSADDYAKDDVVWSLRVWDKLATTFRNPDLKKFFDELAMPILRIITEMELEGMRVDIPYLWDLKKRLEEEHEELRKNAVEVAGCEINFASTNQLSDLMFGKMGIKPFHWMERGKNGKYSTAESVLSEYSSTVPLADVVLSMREKKKLLGTYITKFIELASGDPGNRIYPNIHQTSTVTGRFSCSAPNLQNIPKKEGTVKRAFISKPGFKLVIIDFSQLELRLMAHFSEDERMLEVYNTEGGDIHTLTQEMLGIQDRRVAKACNFGLIYGMSAKTFSNTLWLQERIRKSEEECQEWKTKFFMTYEGVKRFHAKTEQKLYKDGYVKTLCGRFRHLDEDLKTNIGYALRAGVNAQIQGSAADVTLIAMRNFMNKVWERRKSDSVWRDVRMLMQVHDEIIVEAPDELAEQVLKELTFCMETSAKLRVPLKADGRISTTWEPPKKEKKVAV